MSGYCHLSVIPARAEPSDRSEMTNQVLFGEHFELIEKQGNWCRIRLEHDDYECWVDEKQVTLTTPGRASDDGEEYLVDELSAYLENKSSSAELTVVLGSVIPPHDHGSFTLGKTHYRFNGALRSFDNASLNDVLDYAYLYLNAPYLWGGRTPFGIDCSGFTQMVYRMCGIAIPRDSREQAEAGDAVDLLEEAGEGDLVFFHHEDERISHVGIAIPDPETAGHQIIHASGQVRIDRLDEQGIFNTDTQQYSHQLHCIRTFR